MRSLDTNVLARALLGDNAAMAARADDIIAEPAMVLPGVLMELVWALKSSGGWTRDRIHEALMSLLTIPTLRFAEVDHVRWALDRYRSGADFADMLHLAMSGAADSFATFDQGMARFADASVVPIETLIA